jgi:hypothetical protein
VSLVVVPLAALIALMNPWNRMNVTRSAGR